MANAAGLGALLAMADDDSDGGGLAEAAVATPGAGSPTAREPAAAASEPDGMEYLNALADDSDCEEVAGTPSKLPRSAFDDCSNNQRGRPAPAGVQPSPADRGKTHSAAVSRTHAGAGASRDDSGEHAAASLPGDTFARVQPRSRTGTQRAQMQALNVRQES